MAHSPNDVATSPVQFVRADEGADVTGDERRGSGNQDNEALGTNLEGERASDGSTENCSGRSAITLDDVADCEIPWEDIILGDRIGLGSYGLMERSFTATSMELFGS